jgi:hypothetical protein
MNDDLDATVAQDGKAAVEGGQAVVGIGYCADAHGQSNSRIFFSRGV